VAAGHLVLEAFAASNDLPAPVTTGFAEATRSVALAFTDLGIVRAAVTGQTAVSRASELPPDTGSGRWLRAFDAEVSIAAPLLDSAGRVLAVLSVALPSREIPVETIVEVLRAQGQRILARD
jgi:hypothetical protein